MEAKPNHYWLKSGFIQVLQSAAGILLSFGSFYMIIRLFSKYEFGAWTLFTATMTILEFVRNGMVQGALIKYLAAAPAEEKPKIISASLTISAIITIILVAANFGLSVILSHIWKIPEMVVMFLLYNIVLVFSAFLSIFNGIEQASLKYRGIFVSTITRQGVLFLYILASWLGFLKLTLIGLVVAQIAGTFVGASISYTYIKVQFKVVFALQKEWIHRLFNYGKYAFGTTISAMLSNSIDQMMLGGLLSAAAAGVYNVAVRITNLVEIPTSSIATIVFPQSASRMESGGKDAVKYLYERSVGVVLAILLPGLLVLFVFANYIVAFIAGHVYDSTIPVLRITVLYCIIIPYGRQFGVIIDSIGRPKITFIIVVITAFSNLLLNYFFIKHYGVLGAAWATLISNFFGFVIAQIILKRLLDINLINTLIYAVHFYPEMYRKYVRPLF